jgi:hypothetical protein
MFDARLVQHYIEVPRAPVFTRRMPTLAAKGGHADWIALGACANLIAFIITIIHYSIS